MPIVDEDIDGLSGLLFPFYDADTHMLYLAGKVRLSAPLPSHMIGPLCSVATPEGSSQKKKNKEKSIGMSRPSAFI